jgi:hypothetical protein
MDRTCSMYTNDEKGWACVIVPHCYCHAFVITSITDLRPRAHQRNWKPQRNHNFLICAAPFSNMCSTQADKAEGTPRKLATVKAVALRLPVSLVCPRPNISRKLRLRCCYQFPWCALGLRFSHIVHFTSVSSPLVFTLVLLFTLAAHIELF